MILSVIGFLGVNLFNMVIWANITAVSYTHLALKMADNIDFDCSGILESICSINDSGEALFQLVSQVCNGLETKAEQLGFQDVSMARYCNFA